MAEWFKDRRWRVCTELGFEHDDMVVRNGELWVKNGKVFKTPFGNKGTHGYILQEVNPDTGLDVWDDKKHEPSRAPFGWVTIKHADEMFPGSIVEVPPRPYGKRGGVSAARDTEGGDK
jgi:hypothetical protein